MNTVLITVRGIAQKCWKCQAPSGAVVALHRADDLRLDAACWHDDEPVLTLAKELLTTAGHHIIAEQITERYSRTAEARYLSNGCHQCGALFGAFFLSEESLRIAANGGASLAAFLALATQPVAAIRWGALVDIRNTVMG